MDKCKEVKRHKELHESLDILVACMIEKTKKRPSEITVLELMQWSHEQTKPN